MMDELAPGQVIADKYRVECVLGEGGMGYVVAAYHLKLEQRVALKFLKPEALKHPHVVQRFAREARAAARIRGEHVARVIDVGDLPSGSPYIVMEYLEGEDLAHRLHERGPLPIAETVGYMLEVCEALAEAHAAGIVHRDLKPPNLFLARSAGRIPIVKVLDFGISKTLEEDAATGRNLTSTSMVMGTPHYMSPEQLRSSRDVDARSDIWALGVVLFELLTGEPPFDGENTTAIITSIVMDEPRQLLRLRPDAPPELAQVVHRCLAKPRAERFADVLELARALAPFAGARAKDSLHRIESIVTPMLSNPPPPDTVVSPDVTFPTTSYDPVRTAPRMPTGPTVNVSGQRDPGTHANWDATLAAATGASPTRPRRHVWLAAPVALLAGGAVVVWALRAPSTAAPLPEPRAAPQPAAHTPPATALPTASTLPAPAASTEMPAPSSTSIPAAGSAPATAELGASAHAPAAPAARPRKLDAKAQQPAATTAAPTRAPQATTKPPSASAQSSAGGSLRMGIK